MLWVHSGKSPKLCNVLWSHLRNTIAGRKASCGSAFVGPTLDLMWLLPTSAWLGVKHRVTYLPWHDTCNFSDWSLNLREIIIFLTRSQTIVIWTLLCHAWSPLWSFTWSYHFEWPWPFSRKQRSEHETEIVSLVLESESEILLLFTDDRVCAFGVVLVSFLSCSATGTDRAAGADQCRC